MEENCTISPSRTEPELVGKQAGGRAWGAGFSGASCPGVLVASLHASSVVENVNVLAEVLRNQPHSQVKLLSASVTSGHA